MDKPSYAAKSDPMGAAFEAARAAGARGEVPVGAAIAREGAMCAAAISLARIRRLYYAASDEKGGAVEHGARFFSQPTCHHAPEVYEGFRASEAAALLRAFFADRRGMRSGSKSGL